ncbi:MAG: S-layer homology domain-containing protein [Cohnella sp.]|nr:S-layer homology domain-containing protein [Cohnella sp.]
MNNLGKKLISLLLAIALITIFSTSVQAAAEFDDVSKNNWAYDAIHEMVYRKVMDLDDNTFGTNRMVTRGELAHYLVAATRLVSSEAIDISDVKPTDEYYDDIIKAIPYLPAYDKNDKLEFRPNQPVNREEFTVAIAKIKGLTPSDTITSKVQAVTPDFDSISTDAQPYVAVALYDDLMRAFPDLSFQPQLRLSRTEVAYSLWVAFYNQSVDYRTVKDTKVIVTSLKVIGPDSPLAPKQTFQLKPEIATSPAGKMVKATYSSSNSKVASVSVNGLITAVSTGNALIDVSAGGKKATVKVAVVAA